VPNAGVIADGHVAEHDGGLREINFLAELRLLPQKRVELFVEFAHARNLFLQRLVKNKNPVPHLRDGSALFPDSSPKLPAAIMAMSIPARSAIPGAESDHRRSAEDRRAIDHDRRRRT